MANGVERALLQPDAPAAKAPARKAPGRKPAAARAIEPAAAAPVRRSKGRPRSEDAKLGPDEIIRATCELLQTMPISKLTSAAVARRIGAHPALINYYFKTRAELLTQTAAHMIRELRAMTDFDPSTMDSEEALRTRLTGMMGFHRQFPFVHQLIVNEVLNSPSAAAQTVFEDMTRMGLEDVDRFVDRGVESGQLRRVEPAFLYVSLIGMCQFFDGGRAILDYRYGKTPRAELGERYLDFIADMVVRGLQPR